MQGRLYRNKKTGQYYRVENIAIDATNVRNSHSVVTYRRSDTYSPLFVRDLPEFEEKFELVNENDRFQD